MPILYVARSAKLGRWASDVGLGKNIYKVGISEEDPKALAAAGWAGEAGWKIVRAGGGGAGKADGKSVRAEGVEGLSEDEALDRLQRKEKMIAPNISPKLKGALGV